MVNWTAPRSMIDLTARVQLDPWVLTDGSVVAIAGCTGLGHACPQGAAPRLPVSSVAIRRRIGGPDHTGSQQGRRVRILRVLVGLDCLRARCRVNRSRFLPRCRFRVAPRRLRSQQPSPSTMWNAEVMVAVARLLGRRRIHTWDIQSAVRAREASRVLTACLLPSTTNGLHTART